MSVIDSRALADASRTREVVNDTDGVTMVPADVIAHVLRRPHRNAQAHNKPHEARAILHVAFTFAETLSEMDRRFDRTRFIKTSTESIYAPTA
jgi:inosine-uridine nucleoside N-ribohydrolase